MSLGGGGGGGNMRINADSSGGEGRICQGSVQLYQSVNSHNYDENFGAHCAPPYWISAVSFIS